nr:pre-toxin TG domain-containing protein [Clostridium sp. C8-1-8]
MKSGDFNFETEGEKKLSIGLDFIPILGIEKMTLEGLLGEDLVSGRDLNGLERILSVAPAGIGAIAKVKNAIKLGEIGGKVEGSISFGMNGGGQLDNIISKLKESKAEEDMVAKEAVTIDKGGSKADIIIDGLKVIDGKVPISEYNELRDLSIHNKSYDSITLGKYLPTINSDGTENWKIAKNHRKLYC